MAFLTQVRATQKKAGQGSSQHRSAGGNAAYAVLCDRMMQTIT
jgi:hypothetical protein